MGTGEPASASEKVVFISLIAAVFISVGSLAYMRLAEPPEAASRRTANSARTRADMARLERAAQDFHVKYGRYPQTLESLAPEFIEVIPVDPWNRPYLWRKEGGTWRIVCHGKDGQPGKHPWFDLETVDAYVFLSPDKAR